MSKKNCESCARWEQATFKSLFIFCPQCGRARDRIATAARDAKINQRQKEEVEAQKRSPENLRVIQAVLDVYDDHVLRHGANSKHVSFIVTQRAVAERMNTTRHYVKKALALYGISIEQILVTYGRGRFRFVESGYRNGHQFRYFVGYERDESTAKQCA